MPLTPTQKETARFLIRRYCERSEDNRPDIHYAQLRPMTHLGKSPDSEFTCDCSGHATGAFRWADLHTKFRVKDPNGLNYSGYGFTGTLLSYNRAGRVPYDREFMIGDMALYGPSLFDTRHVVICRRNGKASKAIWTSHGSENGPISLNMYYRNDLLIVVRAEDLR